MPRDQICSEACELDLSCGDGLTCTAYPFGVEGGAATFLGVCAESCADDGDCDAQRVCTYNGDPLSNRFDAVCETAQGAGELGAACVDSGDCVTGLCTPSGCTRVCNSVDDCGGTLPSCASLLVAAPNGSGTATLSVCQ